MWKTDVSLAVEGLLVVVVQEVVEFGKAGLLTVTLAQYK